MRFLMALIAVCFFATSCGHFKKCCKSDKKECCQKSCDKSKDGAQCEVKKEKCDKCPSCKDGQTTCADCKDCKENCQKGDNANCKMGAAGDTATATPTPAPTETSKTKKKK